MRRDREREHLWLVREEEARSAPPPDAGSYFGRDADPPLGIMPLWAGFFFTFVAGLVIGILIGRHAEWFR